MIWGYTRVILQFYWDNGIKVETTFLRFYGLRVEQPIATWLVLCQGGRCCCQLKPKGKHDLVRV